MGTCEAELGRSHLVVNATQVLGVELINEPFAGDFFHHPLSMIPYPNPLNADKRFLVNLEHPHTHPSGVTQSHQTQQETHKMREDRASDS